MPNAANFLLLKKKRKEGRKEGRTFLGFARRHEYLKGEKGGRISWKRKPNQMNEGRGRRFVFRHLLRKKKQKNEREFVG